MSVTINQGYSGYSLEISAVVRLAIVQKLQPAFEHVFEAGPATGDFAFRREPDWPHYYRAVCQEKSIYGVWVCRDSKSGVTWFPVYHFKGEDEDPDTVVIPNGSEKYAYIESGN